MLTKMEINSPHTLKYSINVEEDLDLCIKALSNEITTCILYFGTCQLSINRLILLTEGLKSKTNLKTLDLSFSRDFQYEEEEPTTINLFGKAIKELKSLESLRLRCFYGDISNIAYFIQNSDTLKVLSISRTCENDMFLIANALKINKNLTMLEVHDSGIEQGFLALAQSVTNHTNLKSIVLKSDCYYGNDFDILELLKSNQSLEEIVLPHLHISSSKIQMHIKTQNDFELALYFIEKAKNPRELELGLREPFEISLTQQEQLGAKLNQWKGLQSAQLVGFSNTNFISFYEQVMIANSSIEQLTFRIKGNLNHQSAVLLADLIKNNSKLTSLSIGPTQDFTGWERNFYPLSSDDASLIFKALENNKSLIHVDLSGNSMGNIHYEAEDVAKVLKNNIGLRSLNLERTFTEQNQSIAVQTILAAVAENQTLKSLNISYNKALSSIFDNSLIHIEKNTSLTELQIFKEERSIFQNYIRQDTCLKIEQIIKRNIKIQTWGLFQNFILLNYMSEFFLPKEVHNLIFNLTLADLGIVELARVSKSFKTDFKPSLQLTNVESPSNIEKKEVKILNNKRDNFKTIYKALYEGQSSLSLFKSWNSLVDKADLTEAEICNYVKENPDSRSATAWQLALKYEIKANKNKLFKKTHHYAYTHSSSAFGLFKQSRFSENYVNLDTQISQAEQGSRTDTIAGILQSIK
ncbi:MAG: hypothetical protein H0T84_04910 [Tatlockia sp.]|nr:hypothetical protein [Tatlockia sp.]